MQLTSTLTGVPRRVAVSAGTPPLYLAENSDRFSCAKEMLAHVLLLLHLVLDGLLLQPLLVLLQLLLVSRRHKLVLVAEQVVLCLPLAQQPAASRVEGYSGQSFKRTSFQNSPLIDGFGRNPQHYSLK